MRNLAQKHNIEILDHDKNIGGRFSCFSITSLLPLHIAGIDAIEIKKFVDWNFKQNLLNNKYSNTSSITSLVNIFKEKKYVGHVFLVYLDKFKNLAQWYKQLWTESLGKDGKGLHLISAIGAIDQHSQLQMVRW